LRNEKLETFALSLARGRSMTQAAVDAGWKPATAHASGSRAAKREDVQGRVAELREMQDAARAEAIKAVEMPTRELVLRELIDVAERAKSGGQLQAQLRAIELLGKELGMFVQRSSVVVESPLASLRPDALLALSRVLEGHVEEQLELEDGADVEALNPRTDDAPAMSDA
jgi:hypothetical protein